MFTFARWIVRHKIGAVAVVALGVVLLSPSADEEEAANSNSPWSAQASTQVAVAEEEGFMDQVMAEAEGLAAEAGFGEVVEQAGDTAGRFDEAAENMSGANRR